MISNSDRNHKFLFSLPGLENVDSARKEMIRRLYDACIYSILLGDVQFARKAFGLLLRCKEFKWKDFWSLAIYMLNPHDPDRDNAFILSRVEQLNLLMVQDRARVSPSTSTCFWTCLTNFAGSRIVKRSPASVGPKRSFHRSLGTNRTVRDFIPLNDAPFRLTFC